MSTWREKARAHIRRVQEENPDAGGEQLRRILRENYPFGERRWHPYKVWLEEVRRACGDTRHSPNLRRFWVDMGKGE